MTDIDPAELEEFKIEAFEMLDESEQYLLDIDSQKDYKQNFDGLFRVFHSLKGALGMLGLDELRKLMHHLESHLSHFKDAETMPKAYVTYFLEGIDATKDSLNNNEVNFVMKSMEELNALSSGEGASPAAASESSPDSSSQEPPVASIEPSPIETDNVTTQSPQNHKELLDLVLYLRNDMKPNAAVDDKIKELLKAYEASV